MRDFILELYEEYPIIDFLEDFLSDKENGIEKMEFSLIPKQQYINLINRYMSAPSPEFARIPDKVVDEWIKMTGINFLKIVYGSELAGHCSYFPSDDCRDVFGDDIDWNDYEQSSEYLDKIGFYDWCRLPDDTDCISDYGLDPIFKIFKEYSDTMSSWEKLLLINRILDVTHVRGDLSSAFIEGGKKTCFEVSGLHENRVLKFNEFLWLK